MTQAGGLFSEYFLTEGVIASPDWSSITDDRLKTARDEISALLADFRARHSPQEAETERDLIDKLLTCLGWSDFLVQIKAAKCSRVLRKCSLMLGGSKILSYTNQIG